MGGRGGNLGSPISESLRRIFPILPGLTKFGTINRFVDMNFWFNEKHNKSQFCVTSWKRSIQNGQKLFTLTTEMVVLLGAYSENQVPECSHHLITLKQSKEAVKTIANYINLPVDRETPGNPSQKLV